MQAIQQCDPDKVRDVIAAIDDNATAKAVLCSPSNDSKFELRTPLMAAAASGVFEVFTTTLHAFDDIYVENEEEWVSSSFREVACIYFFHVWWWGPLCTRFADFLVQTNFGQSEWCVM